mmetsp:Transcript_37721/g.56116  ORF Transcript_37721/g.56116 Transcript_37721/m.56116 type:complete len:142 (-) Transcript_37721:399-824(-)|eukprot:CAMPEP_0194047278 /NCGR_PEP_ID=MMETSP0009_2-20130614/23769_1 /TAXON_ID=210454 /ORGANISM="Grammatophora oceanica, Strain CCMP 410" /LENGTH=141 /DNA_ID=CAMNT_0038692835 /DNA_START=214 /DNA_END=639 /DNA_ORIENTATION=-
MARNYKLAKQHLEATFPGLKVTGENYPPPPIIGLLSNIVTLLQVFTLALIVFGDGLWTNILRFRRVPDFYYYIKDFGWQAGFAIYFLIPQILAKYQTSGAFEVTMDETLLVYSKLSSGRMPNVGQLVDPIINAGLIRRDGT